jgi:diguanylate cyclase (GGDEF)-like protein
VIGTVLTFGFVLMCSDRYMRRRQQAQDALKRAALIDDLTQLPNRAMVSERLRKLEADSKERPGAAFAVLFVDLDHFKYVNDSLGHEAGDQLLVETADRLSRIVRQNDLVVRDYEVLAGRFGGDEFVLVLSHISEPKHAVRVAERVLDAMAKPFQLNGQAISIQCSIGISTSLGGYSVVDDLLRDADTAMYQAKASGRATYIMFDESMHAGAQKRLRIENELRAAIDAGEIAAWYQPIVALASGRIVGFEALARWVHPERGVIPPDEFIPIAEETGLIIQIGHIVLEQATRTMERMSAMPGGETICMNVNVSRRQLVDERFRTDIRQVVGQLAVPAGRLHLELTETAVSGVSPVIAEVLHELKSLGVMIQLDDFGAGLSSLSLLRTLPLDGLKVDRSFIDATSSDAQAIAILSGIVSLGHSLGKTITVEGISEAGQLATVRALDCDLAQGYLFGRPMTADEAAAILKIDFSSYCAAA